jgi:hypothetical protein
MIGALRQLRTCWDSERAQVRVGAGLAIYFALCEMANEQRARGQVGSGDSARFRTAKSAIGEQAGVSGKSVERACAELARIGLLKVENDRQGENRPGRPSYYRLLDHDPTYDSSSHVENSERTTAVRTSSDSSSDVDAEGTTDVRTSLYRGKKEQKKEKHTEGERPKSKVGGKPVTDAEYLLTDSIVAAFNAAAGTAVTTDAHLVPVVGRIREKPDLTADEHRAIIAAVFALPWWAGGASPAVIYGNAAQFERSIETWRAAPAAKLRLVDPTGPARMATKMEIRRLVRARARLRGASAYRLWVKPLRFAGIVGDTVHLIAPEDIRAWAERRYSGLIADALAAEDLPARVSFAAVEITDHREAA